MRSIFKDTIGNESGFAIIVALIMLAIITVMGIAATRTSEIETRIASNERLYNIAFYAAEAGTTFVAESPSFYGSDNITVGGALSFPNDTDPSETYALSVAQSFNGEVEYLGSSAPPRGSGYDAEKFKAHRYQMTCSGYGSLNSTSQIEIGFYRIGF